MDLEDTKFLESKTLKRETGDQEWRVRGTILPIFYTHLGTVTLFILTSYSLYGSPISTSTLPSHPLLVLSETYVTISDT